MKRKMKVILLLLMMTGIWTGCRGREDARLTDRAEDTVRTQDSSGDIGSDAEDPENPENPEDLENHKDLENPEDPEITETGTEGQQRKRTLTLKPKPVLSRMRQTVFIIRH